MASSHLFTRLHSWSRRLVVLTFGYNGNMSRLELSPDKWTKILQFSAPTVRRSGRRMPFYRSRPPVVAGGRLPLRRPMAAPPRSMGTGTASTKGSPAAPGYLGTAASAFGRRPGYGIPHHRQHGGPGPPLRCGSAPKKGGQAAQALGRSRGGFSTKVHVSVDGLGNPLRFILTGGQQHDITGRGADRRLCR